MTSLLGGLTAAQFLAKHWQKEPLLVRQAIPGFTGFAGMATPRDLAKLASKANAVARTVRSQKKHWHLEEGPFAKIDVDKVPREAWTLLVQGVEQHVDGAWNLLKKFDFIPTARVDDLMVSWATRGGSVGAHFDAYDVFLLQGSGKRHWRVTKSLDTEQKRACVENEDIRVLKRFDVAHEWTLAAGDMLYLPPNVGHWGVAVDDDADGNDPCMTFSIGFLAPSHEQLVHNFLAYLGQDVGAPEGMYSDPDLFVQNDPAELVDASVARVERVLAQLTWDRERVAVFLGRLLTGPKPSVQFMRPKKPLDARAFRAALESKGTLKLAGASRMLMRADRFFLNGDLVELSGAKSIDALRTLANSRALALPVALDDEGRALLHGAYRAGFVVLS